MCRSALRLGRRGCGFVLGLLAAASVMAAQVPPAAEVPYAPQTSLTGEISSLAQRAGVIFVGQVFSVERRGGVVDINFHVEQAITGSVGDTFTLREWAGLWPQGLWRYNVGQRSLLFLHSPSAAGLASPVDGAEGVVPVIVQGVNAPQLLDIRRLGAALLRAPGTPLPTGAEGAILLSEVTSLIAVVRGSPMPAESNGTNSSQRLTPMTRFPVPVRGTAAQAPDAGAENSTEPRPIRRPLSVAIGSAESGVAYAQQ